MVLVLIAVVILITILKRMLVRLSRDCLLSRRGQPMICCTKSMVFKPSGPSFDGFEWIFCCFWRCSCSGWRSWYYQQLRGAPHRETPREFFNDARELGVCFPQAETVDCWVGNGRFGYQWVGGDLKLYGLILYELYLNDFLPFFYYD